MYHPGRMTGSHHCLSSWKNILTNLTFLRNSKIIKINGAGIQLLEVQFFDPGEIQDIPVSSVSLRKNSSIKSARSRAVSRPGSVSMRSGRWRSLTRYSRHAVSSLP